MNDVELQRLAAAIHELRPDWPVQTLRGFLERHLQWRAYRDVAHALVWVACDPLTRTPKRVLEAGPWWLVRPDSEPLNTTAAVTAARCNRCQWFHPPGDACEPPHQSANDVHRAAAKAKAVLVAELRRLQERQVTE